MIDSFPFLAVFFALVALTISPGVDTVLVLRNAARGGFGAGITTSIGIGCGLFVHATISALGLSVILLQSASLFALIKYIGAGFLIYLAIQSLRAAWHGQGLSVDPQGVSQVSLMIAFREGLLSNVFNPKPILFYMMFLPQFIDPSHSAFGQSLIVACIHFIQQVLWFAGLSFMVHGARRYLARGVVARSLNGLTGSLLMVLGIRLAMVQR